MQDSAGRTPSFTKADSEYLRAQLPALAFAPELDAGWAGSAQVQAYLDFYRINFAHTRRGVAHGFGACDAAGFRIATHYWLPENPRGTLVVIHGYYDHVGIFGHAIEFGLQQGMAVLAFDLPGHGLSSGEPVAITSFDQYADVLDAILLAAQTLLPAPYFAMGQSTGCAVLLNYLWRYDAARTQPRLQRIALCAPLVLPRAWGRNKIAYALLHRFIKTLPRGRASSSHDADFIRFISEHDCLQSAYLAVSWVGAMKQWDKQFRQFPPLPQSVLVVQGDEDMTVAWRYNLEQIKRALPNVQVVMVPGAGHQLVNESDPHRAQVFTAISRHFVGD